MASLSSSFLRKPFPPPAVAETDTSFNSHLLSSTSSHHDNYSLARKRVRQGNPSSLDENSLLLPSSTVGANHSTSLVPSTVATTTTTTIAKTTSSPSTALISSHREALLHSELSTLQAEVERLQSLRRLDEMKHSNTEQRLKRYITSLEQDVQDARTFADQIKTQYEQMVEESSQKKRDDGRRIRTAEQKIMDLERVLQRVREKQRLSDVGQEGERSGAWYDSEEESWDMDGRDPNNSFTNNNNLSVHEKKNVLLQERLKAHKMEIESLRKQVQHAEERAAEADRKVTMVSTPLRSDDENEKNNTMQMESSQSASVSNPLQLELSHTRVKLGDAQRIIRQQNRSLEELRDKTKQLSHWKDTARRYEKRIETCELELKTLRQEKETFHLVETQWAEWSSDFVRKQEQFFKNLESFPCKAEKSTQDKNSFSELCKENDGLNTGTHSSTSSINANVMPLHQFTSPPELISVFRYIQSLEDKLRNLKDTHTDTKQQIEASQNRITTLEERIQQDAFAIEKNDFERKDAENKMRLMEKQLRTIQAQEKIWMREADGMRELLATYKDMEDRMLEMKNMEQTAAGGKKLRDDHLERNKNNSMHTTMDRTGNDADVAGFKLGLSAAREQVQLLEKSLEDSRAEKETTMTQLKSLRDEHERVLHKFGMLKEALFQEREKASIAESRACKAESLAGKGAFNESTTRVLHARSNPLLWSIREKYENEINALKAALEENKDAIVHREPSATAGLDPQKYNQRLKDHFRKQIGLFRESVYLITGYKIDMLAETDRPRFKVRSMYSEREDDHLMFIWPMLDEGELPKSLDLLDSPLAQTVMNEPCFKAMTRFNSVPAFTAGLTLALFEKQTIVE